MKLFPKKVCRRLACEKGVSMIAMAVMIVVIGLLTATGIRLYDTWDTYHAVSSTEDKMAAIQTALQGYYAENGRYPCPAPLDAVIDGPGFGAEVSNDCRAGAFSGTFRAAGRGGKMVRTGTVPVRTLNLKDSYIADGYKHRFIYAVTEDYAVAGQVIGSDEGAISIQDANGNDATAVPGNVVQIVYSMGWDDNGAYTTNGALVQNCDPAAASGQNCDFASNATFTNTVNKSTNENNLFVDRISYRPPNIAKPCSNVNSGSGTPLNTAFLVDTSGSMGWAPGEGNDGFSVQCPATMPGCSRIDVARWAMRRVIPAAIYNSSLQSSPGQTSMTGFVARNTLANVQSNLGNIVFFDPNELTQDNDNDGVPDGQNMTTLITNKNQALETELGTMCPNNSTPLGLHMQALADRLGDSGDPNHPNKITIISDGLSNNGTDPVAVARNISNTYPNLQVDVIDVVGNPSLLQISQITGGSYYRTDNPDALLNALYSSAGICNPYTPVMPTDVKQCGSKGNWWNNN